MGDSSMSMPDPRTMSARVEKPWPLDYRLEPSAHHSRRQPSGGNGQHNSWAHAEGAGRAQIQSAAPFWWRPLAKPSIGGFLSMNAARDVAAIVSKLPARLHQDSTTCVPFPHPLSTGTARKLCVLPFLPRLGTLRDPHFINLVGGESHCDEEHRGSLGLLIRSELLRASLS
ncbi:hypothetical protein VFPFJ_06512 [Purpureocillium lilacinum]|uniref:Uncharacterized protein n=1 Tax=Purpureocillium lilacinum TaxID=33203 RepID=A0A179HKV0_PURLI|nr:hypothetical protein VFPFJ_06512 [Purpureocillium lilacinum]OAQ90099.1 hypothetical protein VFPFJ_06512 [Purpureocillium lilacinum]